MCAISVSCQLRTHSPLPGAATCMGFEMLNVLVAQDPSVLTAGFNSENYTIPLNFTAFGPTSRMTSNNKEVISILSTQPVTMNNHHSGVAPTAFYGNSKLTSTFNVVSTNMDRDGKEFVSTIEGKTLPIYSSQWYVSRLARAARVTLIVVRLLIRTFTGTRRRYSSSGGRRRSSTTTQPV